MSRLTVNREHPLWSVFVRGMAMGAADIVPGVSGGTIALITGIYFRLLEAISGLPESAWQHLPKGHFRAFWQACDGAFLLCLLAGILVIIATLASVISYALDTYPILIWSFFFGLIVASVWHVSRQVQSFRAPVAGAIGRWHCVRLVGWWSGRNAAAAIPTYVLRGWGTGNLRDDTARDIRFIHSGHSGNVRSGSGRDTGARSGYSGGVRSRVPDGVAFGSTPDHMGVLAFPRCRVGIAYRFHGGRAG